MATYLLTWNPAKWNWRNLAVEARALRKGKKLRGSWSCGVSKLIRPGDRLFLLKQGTKPRGIVASGWAKSKPYDAPHWDLVKRRKGIPARFVDLQYDALLEPESEPVLDVAELHRGSLAEVHWRTQISGIRIPDQTAAELERLWAAHLTRIRPAPAEIVAEDHADYGVTPAADEEVLLRRITVNPAIFGGKPIVRGRRLAVEHVLGMLAAGDEPQDILEGYPWLQREDIQACLVYARRTVGNERIEPLRVETRS